MIQMARTVLLTTIWGVLFLGTMTAQTTTFTYQGSLNDGATAANGNYDLDFRLFNALSGGAQLGVTVTVNGVTVTNGIFSVQLDFGGQFPGADRFLEIRVRQAGGGAFTLLTPRQRVNSSPYAIKSLSAETATNTTQLGGLTASGFVQNTTAQQPTSNFNISGNGTAGGTLTGNAVNSATQFNIGGNRVLSTPGSDNVFAGVNAGAANQTGSANSFFGKNAGAFNTDGSYNSFFGELAGHLNSTGNQNSFFGDSAGIGNTSGQYNSFFGNVAGSGNQIGSYNAFFGALAGISNTSGGPNTAIGYLADFSTGSLTYATAIGAGSVASTNNSVVLGRAADTVRVPGGLNVTGSTFLGGVFVVSNGSLATFTGSASVSGNLSVSTLGSAGATALCRNASNQIATCSSSLRYKSGVTNFTRGLDIVNRLRPISFSWRDGGMKDVGFGAEEIAKIDDRFVTYNDKGEVEGVKYAQITTVLVNAVKEQQILLDEQNRKLETQENRIKQLKEQVRLLTNVICSTQKDLQICKEQK